MWLKGWFWEKIYIYFPGLIANKKINPGLALKVDNVYMEINWIKERISYETCLSENYCHVLLIQAID